MNIKIADLETFQDLSGSDEPCVFQIQVNDQPLTINQYMWEYAGQVLEAEQAHSFYVAGCVGAQSWTWPPQLYTEVTGEGLIGVMQSKRDALLAETKALSAEIKALRDQMFPKQSAAAKLNVAIEALENL